MEWGSNVHAAASSDAIESSIVRLEMSTEDSDGRRRRLKVRGAAGGRRLLGTDDTEPLLVVLQNTDRVVYLSSSVEKIVTLKCPTLDYRGNVTGRCPSPLNITVRDLCDGTWLERNITCASSSAYVPSCKIWSTETLSWDSTSCRAVNWTETNTTCKCDKLDSIADVEFTSASELVANSFANLATTNVFSAENLLKSVLVFITFGSFMLLSSFFAYFGAKLDERDSGAVDGEESEAQESEDTGIDDAELAQLTPKKPRWKECVECVVGLYSAEAWEKEPAAPTATGADVNDAIDASMPEWVQEDSWSLFKGHLNEEHPWLSLWYVYDEVASRPVRSIQLYVDTMWMMFAEALCFYLVYPPTLMSACKNYDGDPNNLPDDPIDNECDCLMMDGPYDPRLPACMWVKKGHREDFTDSCNTSPDGGYCQMREPNGNDPYIFVVFLLLVTCTLIPFEYLLEYLFDSIILAPLARPDKDEDEDGADEEGVEEEEEEERKEELPAVAAAQAVGALVASMRQQLDFDGPKRTKVLVKQESFNFEIDQTPATIAAGVQIAEKVSKLVKMGADASAVMKDGSMVLHLLCRKCPQVTKEQIQSVVAADRLAAEHPDKLGWLPLHLLCRFCAELTEAKVRLLFGENGLAATRATSEGLMPLHVMCRYRVNLRDSVLASVIDAHPAATDQMTDEGWLPLHYMCRYLSNLDVDKLRIMLTQNGARPLEQRPVEQQSPAGIVKNDDLETAASPSDLQRRPSRLRKSVRTVQTIMGMAKPAASVPTDKGLLPLHILCRYCIRFDPGMLELMIKAYPESVKVSTNEGWLPLHNLCRYSPVLDVEMLHIMLEPFEDAAKQKNKNGSTPLHLLCGAEQISLNSAMLARLLEAHPDAVREKNKIGSLPLHLLCNKGRALNEETFTTLLNAGPDTAAVTNSLGQSPLHLVCGNEQGQVTDAMVQALVDACPEATAFATNQGCLPLHLLCGKTGGRCRIRLILVSDVLLASARCAHR